MDQQELKELILHGREERNLEYKGHENWRDSNTKAKITKSVLGMSNIRDGGSIIIGVEQDGESFNPVGLTSEERDSFTQDGVSAYINEFADPYAEITVSQVGYEGAELIVIQVKEFAEIPVICKRDGANNLQKGNMYTRSRRIAETCRVPSQVEMREILDIAVEKGMRGLHGRIARSGLVIMNPQDRDQELFDDQLEGL